MELRLTNVIDGNDHLTFRFPPGQTARLGRDPAANDVILHDPSVSRSHALIRPDVSGYVAEDLGSKKGTLVNGATVASPTPLHSGDVLEVGPFVLVVTIEGLHAVRAAEKTHRLELTKCPSCGAHVLQDFESCLVCGAVL